MATKTLEKENYREEIGSELIEAQKEHARQIKVLKADNRKLLAIIAHDMKGPMSSLLAFLTILRDKLTQLDRDEIERHVDIALLSSKKTYNLLDNLLEWAFAENELKAFHQKEIDINDLIHEELEILDLFAATKKIRIESKNISHELVFIDVNMVRTIIRNLLNNAIKYSHQGGEIDISAEKKNGCIEVSIRDNGIGMKQEIQDVIFSENSYHSRIGTADESGTGLGLLLCKEFIDAHGGKIWISSGQGTGSEISFTLPPIT